MSDLISRQAAIDAIEHRLAEPAYQHTGEDWYVGMNCAESELYELPSAQPERKKGKWIYHPDWEDDGECPYECSECGMGSDYTTKYCPRCGADMKEDTRPGTAPGKCRGMSLPCPSLASRPCMRVNTGLSLQRPRKGHGKASDNKVLDKVSCTVI